MFPGPWRALADTWFVQGRKTTQNLFQIALKQRQKRLWSGLTIALLVWSEQTRYTSCWGLSHAQYFVEDMSHAVFWDACCLSYLASLNHRSANTKSWTFVTSSSVEALFWASGLGSSKADVQPCWRSLNHFLMVGINDKESLHTVSKRSFNSLDDNPTKRKVESLTYVGLFPFSKIQGHARFSVSPQGQTQTRILIRLKFWK